MCSKFTNAGSKLIRAIEKLVMKYPKLLIIFALIIVYIQFLIPTKWVPRDNYDMVLPIYTDISLHLKNGCLPLWSFFWQRGVPLGNLIGPNVWDPVTFILGLVGYTSIVVQYQYVATVIAGALGFYLVAVKYTESKKISAIIAVVFASSGFMAGQNDNYCFIKAAALLPFWHLTIKNLFERKTVFNSINFGVVFGLIIAINYPVLPVIFLLFTLVEILILYRKSLSDFSLLKYLGISMFVAVGVSGSTIVSTIEIMSQISRSQPLSLDNLYSFFPLHILGIIAPSFGRFGGEYQVGNSGQIYLALPVLAFIIPHKWNCVNVKLIALFIVALLMTMGRYSWLYQLFFYYVPGFEYMRFPNFIRIFAMFYVLLLGARTIKDVFNLDSELFIRQVRKRLFILLMSCFSVVILILLCAVITWNTHTDYFRCCSEIAVQMLILFILTKFIGSLPRSNELLQSMERCKHIFIASIIFFAFTGAVISFGGTSEPQDQNDQLIRGLYAQPKLEIENQFVTTDNSKNIYLKLINSKGYLGGFELEQNIKSQENKNYIKSGMPLVWQLDDQDETTTSNIKNVSVRGNTLSFFVSAGTEGKVVVEQNYFPHWLVSVDHKDWRVNKNDNATIGIMLPAGEHFVELEYYPSVLRAVAYCSIICWLVIAVYYILKFKRRTK